MELKLDEIEIEVKALGVNFRDVLIILGKYYDDEGISCECAGIVTNNVGPRCILRYHHGLRKYICEMQLSHTSTSH